MSASERERTARVVVIGAGLAGSEAAWQIAQQGVAVTLYEMRPVRRTPAHVTGMFAELVCSNSLRSNLLTNAVGVLKEEMRRLGSLIMAAADKTPFRPAARWRSTAMVSRQRLRARSNNIRSSKSGEKK